MPAKESLMEEIGRMLVERSKKAIAEARQAVIGEKIKYTPLYEALCYFMDELWFHSSHPALLSLACEAVGGDPDAPTNVSAAIVILAGAADIHDDIIDESKTKHGTPTVYGKCGKDLAIIAGNVLWIKGMQMLDDACKGFPQEKSRSIKELVAQSFFDLGSVEAQEASCRGNVDLSPEDFVEMIKIKVSVAEASGKIGAIIGDGDKASVEFMGELGKTLGELMTLHNEFVDMFELDELRNRLRNECLPLPVLYAFQDVVLKKKILSVIENEAMTETQLEEMLELIVNAPSVCGLIKKMHLTVRDTTKRLNGVKKNRDIFNKLLKSTITDL